jgi:hypothetical protein
MDTFSHALWGYGLFGHKRHALIAILFGAAPDLISFGALMLFNMLSGTWHFGKPPLETLPPWLFTNYAFGHSVIICFSVIGLVWLCSKDIAFAMLAWPLHILLDFPFHDKAYFATPLFWPFSDFSIDGIPWSHWYIWYPNVAGLIILLTYRFRQKRKVKNQ